MEIVKRLADAGFAKINFAGGEPFLCPWLWELADWAKTLGMVVSIVTNGSYFASGEVRGRLSILDWLVLSVDSVNPDTLRGIGRVAAHRPMSEEAYLDVCRQVRAAEVNLKINTVVSSANHLEDLSDFIIDAWPVRWKIMQMLPIDGPDARQADDLVVTGKEFEHYVRRNQIVEQYGVKIVPETNDDMIGSYAMVDPAGRFYDNVGSRYHYSRPILDVGVENAFSDVSISRDRFLARGGLYDFAGAVKPLTCVDSC